MEVVGKDFCLGNAHAILVVRVSIGSKGWCAEAACNRTVAGTSGILHARQGLDSPQGLFECCQTPLWLGSMTPIKRDFGGQDIMCIESGIDLQNVSIAVDQQAGTDKEYKGDCNIGTYQQSAQAVKPRGLACRSARG